MRQIVLDLETTGLYSSKGDRIIEVGLVEIIDRQITGKEAHFYVNPERSCSEEAIAIHGLTDDFLVNQPKFFEISSDLIKFIDGAELIIHNAPFDLGFLEVEFELLNMQRFSSYYSSVFDTLKYARQCFPGKRCSLDALCTMFQVSSSHRVKHGALIDAQLLAEVYLCLTRGQESLDIIDRTLEGAEPIQIEKFSKGNRSLENGKIIVFFADELELSAHHSLLKSISEENDSPCVWLT